jgi:hypothetical protein
MSYLLTEYPSVITVENSDGFIPLVMFSREFFLARVSVCKTVGGYFFIFDRISDGKGSYR